MDYYPSGWHRGLILPKHRIRAEKALGRPLPKGAEVHHADGSKRPDAPLVICQDKDYHYLLHIRQRVRDAGGDPSRDRLCRYCGPLPIADFTPAKNKIGGVRNACRSCVRAISLQSRQARRASQDRRSRRYTEYDRALIVGGALSNSDLASLLGRSVEAIKTERQRIHLRQNRGR